MLSSINQSIIYTIVMSGQGYTSLQSRGTLRVIGDVNERLSKIFRNSNLLAATAHIGLAIVVVVAVHNSPWNVPMAIQYSNWTETEENLRCGEKNNTCIISLAEKDVGTFNVGILVPLFSFISGFHHLFAGIYYTMYIDKVEQTGGNIFRAIDYAFSSAFMIIVVSILFKAPSDPMLLTVIACLQILTCFSGYAIEVLKQSIEDSGAFVARVLFGVSCFTYAGLWTALLIPFGYAVADAPPAVSVFISFMVLAFLLFPCIFWLTWSYDTETDLIIRELFYTAASAFSKIPLLVLFWTGVVMRSGTVQFERNLDLNADGSTYSDTELYVIFGGTVLSSITFGAIIIYCAKKN